MQIHYDAKTDLLYIRLDDRKQQVVNRRVSEDVVLDIGEDDRIVGIEILDASKRLNGVTERGGFDTGSYYCNETYSRPQGGLPAGGLRRPHVASDLASDGGGLVGRKARRYTHCTGPVERRRVLTDAADINEGAATDFGEPAGQLRCRRCYNWGGDGYAESSA
jgi:uncharacterized protein YuzE